MAMDAHGLLKSNGRLADPLYMPLDQRILEIRVVDLKPCQDPTADIECQLKTISMTQQLIHGGTPYEALSYSWGDPQHAAPIKINGQVRRIGLNLEAFLRRRRSRQDTVTLWIDALCINQEDVLEKNYQVPIMNVIYLGAQSLTIWLGPSYDNSDVAMDELSSLGSWTPFTKMPNLEPEVVDAFEALLTRPWWYRVWVIQELIIGGSGRKMPLIKVMCGGNVISWVSLVIATVRMRTYHHDQRQFFPNLDHLLELDGIRQSVPSFLEKSNPGKQLEVLVRYKNCLASDPRDKVYALINMFSLDPSKKIPTKYEDAVHDVYLDLAVRMVSAGEGTELLRHAGLSSSHMPSWVPDWSIKAGSLPLPVQSKMQYFDIPWWLEPIPPKDIEKSGFSYKQIIRDLNDPKLHQEKADAVERMKISIRGIGMVKSIDQVPRDFPLSQLDRKDIDEIFRLVGEANTGLLVTNGKTFRIQPRLVENVEISASSSSHVKKAAQLLVRIMKDGEAVFLHLSNGSEYTLDLEPGILVERVPASSGLDPLEKGELEEQRQQTLHILENFLPKSSTLPTYKAAGATSPYMSYEKGTKELSVEAILFDEVDVTRDVFVHDVEADWENATRFMVQVGQCKALALGNAAVAQRYPIMADRLKAFWMTLLVGQKDQTDRLSFEAWLPPVPASWTHSDPLLIPITSGLVDLAQFTERFSAALHRAAKAMNLKPTNFRTQNTLDFEDGTPKWWTKKQREHYKERFAELASLWRKQPYDLYHRPFSLFHTVPDPYWQDRKSKDAVALKMSRVFGPSERCYLQQLPCSSLPGDFMTTVLKEMDVRDVPNWVFPVTLKLGVEKYALGRRFFITKKGYFGLGPSEVHPGDRVAVLLGFKLPFVLRDDSGWRLVGEAYVHDVINGEVLDQCSQGTVERLTIALH